MALRLVTSQRLLSPQDRPLGNSLLQSGAALGAMLTPLVVQTMVSDAPGSWRGPFQLIGVLGMLWIVPWLSMVRASDLRRPDKINPDKPSDEAPAADASAVRRGGADRATFARRFAALMLTVVAINLCFHFFRAWLPKFLREFHGYDRTTVNYFTSAYFVATDVGCLSVGLAVKRLTLRGWPVHSARMATFAGCSLLTSLSVIAAGLPRGPALLALLLVIGFGALGLFPNYYSLTQELSARHQGKVTGVLSCVTWVCTAIMQQRVGVHVDQTRSYAAGIFVVGLLPLVACAGLLLFWNRLGAAARGEERPG